MLRNLRRFFSGHSLIKSRTRALATLPYAFLLCLPLAGGILPDQLGTEQRSGVRTVMPADPVLVEYGIAAAEQADYGRMNISAWRFRDATGAMAAFQYLRPADARPSKLDELAASTGHLLLTAHGNYLLQFVDGVPKVREYAQIINGLPALERGTLPVISTYLPPEGLIPNSERYIVGPVSFEKLEPGIAPSIAAFHTSAEAQYGRYRAGAGEMPLTIFAYPTPGIARERAEAFQKVPGAMVKRTGPFVVFTTNPPSADAAERLLAKINYQAQLTVNEKPAENFAQSTAKMILSIMKLAGIIIVFCLLSGLAFAGFRQLGRRLGKQGADEGMITLHLQSK